MAAPNKYKLEFFSTYVTPSRDERRVQNLFGLQGIGMIILIKRELFSDGFYLKWDDDILECLADEVGISKDEFSQIFNRIIKTNIFDKDLFTKYSILTSAKIQENYITATAKRTRVPISLKYWIADISLLNRKNIEIKDNSINNNSNEQSAELMEEETKQSEIIDTKNSQSKSKSKSKSKSRSKSKNSFSFNGDECETNSNKFQDKNEPPPPKEKKRLFVIPTVKNVANEFTRLCKAQGFKFNVDKVDSVAIEFWCYYNDLDWTYKKTGNKIDNWKDAAKNWHSREDFNSKDVPMDNYNGAVTDVTGYPISDTDDLPY